MISVICPQEVTHHNRLALAYVALMQEEKEEILIRKTREKLQQQLWESKFYDVSTVYGMYESCLSYYCIITKLEILFYSCHRMCQINNLAHRESHSAL